MAIVLTLKAQQDVYIGSTPIVVKLIESPFYTVLTCGGKDYEITPDDWVDILLGCQVRLGRPRAHWTAGEARQVRFQFEAPDYLVLRGSSYRNTDFKKEKSI